MLEARSRIHVLNVSASPPISSAWSAHNERTPSLRRMGTSQVEGHTVANINEDGERGLRCWNFESKTTSGVRY